MASDGRRAARFKHPAPRQAEAAFASEILGFVPARYERHFGIAAPEAARRGVGVDRHVDASDLCLSAVSFGEIQTGIERTRKRDAAKAAEIEIWADIALQSFKILPMDERAFRLWAQLMQGRSDMVSFDAMIASTARVNDLVVATRNVKDFERLGVEVFNPFQKTP